MKILDYVCKSCILSDFEARSKTEVLSCLADALVEAGVPVDRQQVYKVLEEREQLGSTGIGNGVAIPHGRLAGLDQMVILVARSRKGVPFEAVDNEPVHIIFLLLANSEAATEYLKILARISKLLRAPGVYERLLNASGPNGITQVIQEVDGRS